MATIPALSNAAIQSVQDANVRSILRSLSDFLAVRNGDSGNGQDAFLTLADLKGDSAKAAAVAGALALPISAGINKPGTPLDQLGQQLEDRILGSAAWQDMFTRLKLIAAPDDTPGSVSWQLLQEAKARGAAVTNVTTKLQTTSESFAKTTDTLTAGMKDNAAAISREAQVRADANTATATRLDVMATSVGKNTSAIQSESSTRVNSDNALAQALNTMWTRIGTSTALVQTGTEIVANNLGSALTKFEQLQAITTDPNTGLVASYAALRNDFSVTNNKIAGMAAKWSVKLDLNGYVSGLSLNAGVTPEGKSESSFIIAADTFAIGAPGKPNLVPFALDVKTGLLSLKGSIIAEGTVKASALVAKSITAESGVIGDLAVRTANIDDAAIGTLKIAGNAVTAMASATGGSSAVINMNCLGVPVYLSAACQVFFGDGGGSYDATGRIRILRDGMQIDSMTAAGHIVDDTGGLTLSVSTVFVDRPSPGYHNYTFVADGLGLTGEFRTEHGIKINAALLETRR